MSDTNTPDETAQSGNVNTSKTPPATGEAPEWAVKLTRTIEELPGKLRASISDDDKSSIAEHVHGLFERSGAFETGAQSSAEQEADTAAGEAEKGEQQVEHEAPPKKSGWLSGFAAKFAGDE